MRGHYSSSSCWAGCGNDRRVQPASFGRRKIVRMTCGDVVCESEFEKYLAAKIESRRKGVKLKTLYVKGG